MPKKGARADPKKSAPAPAKKPRLRLRNIVSVIYLKWRKREKGIEKIKIETEREEKVGGEEGQEEK